MAVYDDASVRSIKVVDALATDEVASVVIDCAYGDYDNNTIEVVGNAKRDPKDKADAWVGLELAYARAVVKLGETLMRRANGLVKHNDDVAAMRSIQRERKQAWVERQKDEQRTKYIEKAGLVELAKETAAIKKRRAR